MRKFGIHNEQTNLGMLLLFLCEGLCLDAERGMGRLWKERFMVH